MPSEESMIEDLRELEAELREKEEYRKANIIDLFIKYSTHCKIDKSKVEEKIEELKGTEELLSDEQGYWGGSDLLAKIEVLQELLREE